eukprot:3522383-Pleurochrysis_carterae.AAC.1
MLTPFVKCRAQGLVPFCQMLCSRIGALSSNAVLWNWFLLHAGHSCDGLLLRPLLHGLARGRPVGLVADRDGPVWRVARRGQA